jgi:hypothetical protein
MIPKKVWEITGGFWEAVKDVLIRNRRDEQKQ